MDRRAIDQATQAYIDQYRGAAGDARTAWLLAKQARGGLPNDVPLRNAEHYLYSSYQPLGAYMAPGYTAWKTIRDRQLPQDPWGEIKWGMSPVFGGMGVR